MSDKIAFFYAGGTGNYAKNMVTGLTIDLAFNITWADTFIIGPGYGIIGEQPVIAGIDGRTAKWNYNDEASDPFIALLDPNVWAPKMIDYPASMFGGSGGFSMGSSIDYGRDRMIEAILKLPAGAPFALGGNSQGAGVCSSCYLSGLQPGTTGPLESRRSSFLGYVGFGNPRRQRNYVHDGGTWSGTWHDPSAGNTDGGGAFPTTGPWRRLTNCDPEYWQEFVNPGDVYSANGSTGKGDLWTKAIEVFLDLSLPNLLDVISQGIPTAVGALTAFFDAMGQLGSNVYIVDAINRPLSQGGGGHNSYAALPPPNSDGTYPSTKVTVGGVDYLKPASDTSLQIALKWLEAKAIEYARSPSVVPPTPTTPSTAGWSTTLIPPAA